MQNAWVLNQEILINPELYHPCNLSVIKGRVFLGWTSTNLGLMFLLKDTTHWPWWGSNLQPLGLSQALYHWAPKSKLATSQISIF